MKVLSLFSGGGLGDYGLTLAGMEIVGQVEIDEYCQKILSLRWPEVPKWRDIRDVKGSEVINRCGVIDVITGGFPCQDISTAGLGAGIEGERSGLWKEMWRIVCEIRPRFVIVENVSALLGRGLGVVLGDLASSGYDSEWRCVSASDFSAPHKRERVFIVAYPKSIKRESPGLSMREGQGNSRLGKLRENEGIIATSHICKRRWAIEPSVGRVADGIANRVDRLKLLGNGQVVQVVEWIGKRIMGYESRTEPKL